MAAQEQTVPAHVGIFQMMGGVQIAGAVGCVAQLGIPDLVKSGPKSAAELAKQVGADAGTLYRLLRATASVGVLTETADGKFAQTPMSEILTRDAKPSLRAFVIMSNREWHSRGWELLEYSVRTGKTAAEKLFGKPIFKHFQENPEDAQIFQDAMTSFSMIDSPAVASAYSFDGIHSIVDVAGGHGLLLATILQRNPQMKGILFDLPHVVAGAAEGALKPLMSRCSMASGDMFTSIPAGADAYLMKHIIHDWPDAECVAILKACRKAVNPGGKLLVVDCVIQPGNAFAPGKFLDLQMLLFPGGQERTESQFRELLAAGGWKLNRVIPTAAVDSIVEGVPA
jgi:O-methyltransferase domain/Dimerisation domain